MKFVEDSLSFYATIKTYGLLLVALIFFICTIVSIYFINKGNYLLSSDSKISYYNINDSTECVEEQIKNNLCKLQLVYTDGTNIYKYDSDPKSKAGKTIVHYQEKNPNSYTIGNPYIPSGFLFVIFIFIFIIGIIRLYLLKNHAATLGAFDAASVAFDMVSSDK